MKIEDFANVKVFTRRDHLVETASKALKSGLFCEFGVYMGNTTNLIAYAIDPALLHAFDSFEGLPEDWKVSNEITRPKGFFRLSPADTLFFNRNVTLVAGWFNETIPEWLALHDQSISFIHIDCDLYSSAFTVLSLLNSRIKEGTVILFDEYYPWPEGKQLYTCWELGEYKALNDWLTQYNRRALPLYRNNEYGVSIVVV